MYNISNNLSKTVLFGATAYYTTYALKMAVDSYKATKWTYIIKESVFTKAVDCLNPKQVALVGALFVTIDTLAVSILSAEKSPFKFFVNSNEGKMIRVISTVVLTGYLSTLTELVPNMPVALAPNMTVACATLALTLFAYATVKHVISTFE